MFPNLLNANTIPVLEQVVNFAQTRHSVLAGNIANIDTPGYRTRDLSPELFAGRMKQAIEQRDSLQQTISFGDVNKLRGNPFTDVRKDMNSILYHDETNVGIEQQVAEISKNQMQHNVALSIMTSQFRLLEAAVSERV